MNPNSRTEPYFSYLAQKLHALGIRSTIWDRDDIFEALDNDQYSLRNADTKCFIDMFDEEIKTVLSNIENAARCQGGA